MSEVWAGLRQPKRAVELLKDKDGRFHSHLWSGSPWGRKDSDVLELCNRGYLTRAVVAERRALPGLKQQG